MQSQNDSWPVLQRLNSIIVKNQKAQAAVPQKHQAILKQ